MQGKHEDDAAPPVDGGRGGAEGGKELCQQAVSAQQNDPGVGPDERWAHQTHDDEDVQDLLARDIVAGHQVGDGHADQGGGEHRGKTDHHGADQRLVVIGLGEEADEVIQRQALDLIGKDALGQNGVKGIDDEQAHGRNHDDLGKEPEIRPPAGAKLCFHRLSTSPDSAS